MANSLINICGVKDITIIQQLLISTYDEVSDDILTIINNAYKADQYGKKISEELWDQVNDINYFILYSFIMKFELNTKGGNDLNTINSLKDKYKINCIRKHFSCFGFDIDPILISMGIEVGTNLGIDYASLETTENTLTTL